MVPTVIVCNRLMDKSQMGGRGEGVGALIQGEENAVSKKNANASRIELIVYFPSRNWTGHAPPGVDLTMVDWEP